MSLSTLSDKWKLVPLYLQNQGLIKQHLDSFNYFISVDMMNIVQTDPVVDSDVDPSFFLRYTKIDVELPSIQEDLIVHSVTPHECRLRDLTYSAPIVVDIEYSRGKQIVTRKNVQIGRLPIMLRSSRCHLRNLGNDEKAHARVMECPLDPGGYFIIKGTEKVILIQEQLSKNRILLDLDRKGALFASVTSSTHERKSKTYVSVKNERLYIRHNNLVDDIPLFVIMKALGVQADREIVQLICGNDSRYVELMGPSAEESLSMGIVTTAQAIAFLGEHVRIPRKNPNLSGSGATIQSSFNQSPEERKLDDSRDFLTDLLLSHISITGTFLWPKALFLSLMARRVVQALLGDIEPDDRDYVGNKRLELAGELLSLLFEDLFKRFNGDLKRTIDKILVKPNRAQEFDVLRLLQLQGDLITSGMVRALSTGNWYLRRFRMERAGVTQVLSRLSYISGLGMMTRISSQFEKTRKVSGPRSLQTSQWGITCPSDTPEGEACGLVKNLALLAKVSVASDEKPLLDLIFGIGLIEPIDIFTGGEIHQANTDIVFLNGIPIGITRFSKQVVQSLRSYRRKGLINCFVSISRCNCTIQIASDGGRALRPLLILNPKTSLPFLTDDQIVKTHSWEDLVKIPNCIEYLDVNEENDALIFIGDNLLRPPVTRLPYTHMEIAPWCILGAVAGLIPFPDHNQSPRNTYQSAMGKQAMGTIGYNQFERIDTLMYSLVYPQRPLVKTRTIELVNYEKLPAGQNASVAVMSFSGFDIEDALIINKASLDRGFGRCMVLKKATVNLKKYANGTYDRIVAAPHIPTAGRNPISSFFPYPKYEALDADGIASPGERLLSGHTIINKQVPIAGEMVVNGEQTTLHEYKPMGVSHKSPTSSIVDKVLLTTNGEDQITVKVLLRSTRRPEIGDKFSSRHGQKGVCGLIVPQVDMPFGSDGPSAGVSPDIIMNPHGFPSRMTVGKMLELLNGKAGTMEGRLAFGTPFEPPGSFEVPCTEGSEFGSHREARTENVAKMLLKHGFSYSGKDTLISGITGEMLSVYIFFGPIYYQKLKHMVLDKMHARARGPRAVLTRQPTEGRARDGGLRLGEMERDCLIGYGASSLLMERLMISSDSFNVDVCEGCGLLGYSGWCNLCKSSLKISSIAIPYACKLLFQELQSMNIVPRLSLSEY